MTKIKRKNHSKIAIARYWANVAKDKNGTPFGSFAYPEDPHCMACGWSLPQWHTEAIRKTRSPLHDWKNADLEKCHIVPLYLGGVDDVSNIVLMCNPCHRNQPDSIDAETTFQYMRSRTLVDVISIGEAMALINQHMPESTDDEKLNMYADIRNFFLTFKTLSRYEPWGDYS